VYNTLGCGFLEAVYQEALAVELTARGIPFRREVGLPVSYKGQVLDTAYRADFICFDSLIVEIKALDRIGGIEHAQVLNYLKATGLEVGLVINFGEQSLKWDRFAFSKKR